MTTEDIFIRIFCAVDDQAGGVSEVPQAKLYPSEVVTIGVCSRSKADTFGLFYRWLKRDYDALFGGLPDRAAVSRNLLKCQHLCDLLLELPSVLNDDDNTISPTMNKMQIGMLRLRILADENTLTVLTGDEYFKPLVALPASLSQLR
jgi:hypothetical protein